MRCHICNKDMHGNEIKFDPTSKGKFLPCSDCLEDIEETVQGYHSIYGREEEMIFNMEDYYDHSDG